MDLSEELRLEDIKSRIDSDQKKHEYSHDRFEERPATGLSPAASGPADSASMQYGTRRIQSRRRIGLRRKCSSRYALPNA